MSKRPENTKNIILLDAHAILHRAYHALPDFVSTKGEPTGGIYGLSTMLLKIIKDLKPDYLIAAYDLPQPTYRHEAFEGYKGTRTKTDDALVMQIKRSRDVFTAFGIPMYDSPGFEADDILGTAVEMLKKAKDVSIIIASGDMDTMQLVDDKKVQVYTLKKGISDTILYDEEKMKERFGFKPKLLPDYKGLAGDPSDNISGVPGIGEKTATTLITSFGSIEEIYNKLKKDKEAFAKAGIKERVVKLLEEHEEEALFSKELATIRRDAPIHFSLPKERWADSVELSKILALFNELEFRVLGARAKEVLDGARGGGSVDKDKDTETKLEEPEPPQDIFDPQMEKELLVEVSLINSTITDPEREDILRISHTETLAQAKDILFAELKKRKLESIFETIEKPLIPVLLKMQDRGVRVDVALLKELSVEYHKKLSALEKSIWRAAGEEFNINSPKQLGEVLFVKMGLKAGRQKKTSTGALSTKESELEKLRELNPIVADILSHRELQKLLSNYIDTIPTLVAPDGRLHTRYLQNGAATGRMASKDPNLQNIPHKSDLGMEIRKAFVAKKGYKIVACDYSQIELRIAAFLSGDKKLIEIFREGKDIHTAVASEVFGVPEKNVDYEMRRRAKVINFGIIYGMGVTSLQKSLGANRVEAQKFYSDYFARFSTLAEYLENTKQDAYKKGYSETFFGRRRYLEGLKSKLPYVRAMAERQASNAPIQGTEADIIKLAMVRIDELLSKEGVENDVRMLLQVHDELVFEIKEEMVKTFAPRLRKVMESVVDPKETKGVLCTADVSVGDNWAELEKLLP
ncbi:MAG TPA: DNA polymerase [Candidatus Paceibacterota bacterium]